MDIFNNWNVIEAHMEALAIITEDLIEKHGKNTGKAFLAIASGVQPDELARLRLLAHVHASEFLQEAADGKLRFSPADGLIARRLTIENRACRMFRTPAQMLERAKRSPPRP